MTWDGDDLAGQMEEELERQQAMADAQTPRVNFTAAERALNAERESLRLSMSRIESQLTLATNPTHRTMLERAQESIKAKLADLEAK